MMKRSITICVAVSLLLVVAGSVTAVPSDYNICDHWGGTWADAEKSLSNTEDDYMCWAAAASNILEWTGLGKVGGMTNTDDMFDYFQKHWTDEGGEMKYGWNWWFTGTNPSQGWPNYSQVDVNGGGFYPSLNFSDYFHETSETSKALSAVDEYLHNGYGTTLSVGFFQGSSGGAHTITCWGFQYDSADPNYYTGVWVTDSDDDKNGDPPRPNNLRYYDVKNIGGAWYLQDFYETNNWYIVGVQALAIPEPATIALLGLGALSLLRRRKNS